MSLLITGGTGFIGSHLIEQLVPNHKKLFVCVRPQSFEKAQRKFSQYSNIELIRSDLSHSDFILDDNEASRITPKITQVVHLAADYHINSPHPEAYLHNVVGTHNLLHFLSRCENLQQYHHTSSIAVAGDFEGMYYENQFNLNQHFNNPYAQTKFRSEGLVGAWKHPAQKLVYRLGIVVGNSHNGHIPKLDGPYYFLKTLKKLEPMHSILRALPALPLPYRSKARLHLIPVDEVVEVLKQSIERTDDRSFPKRKLQTTQENNQIKTYHLTGPSSTSQDALLVKDFIRLALDHFDIKTPIISCPPQLFHKSILSRVDFPVELLHYMRSIQNFDTQNLKEDFPNIIFKKFVDYQKVFFEYADKMLKGSDQ